MSSRAANSYLNSVTVQASEVLRSTTQPAAYTYVNTCRLHSCNIDSSLDQDNEAVNSKIHTDAAAAVVVWSL